MLSLYTCLNQVKSSKFVSVFISEIGKYFERNADSELIENFTNIHLKKLSLVANNKSDKMSRYAYLWLVEAKINKRDKDIKLTRTIFKNIHILSNNQEWEPINHIKVLYKGSFIESYLSLLQKVVKNIQLNGTAESHPLSEEMLKSTKFRILLENNSRLVACYFIQVSPESLYKHAINYPFSNKQSKFTYYRNCLDLYFHFSGMNANKVECIKYGNLLVNNILDLKEDIPADLAINICKASSFGLLEEKNNLPSLFKYLGLPNHYFEDFDYCKNLIEATVKSKRERASSSQKIKDKSQKSDLKRKICIMMSIWGDIEIYINSFRSMSWATIENSTDFKYLNEKYEIYFQIYTTIESLSSIKKVAANLLDIYKVNFNTDILKSEDSALQNRGRAYIDAFKNCADNNEILFVSSPDVIYGNGLSKMIDSCPEGGISAVPILRGSQQRCFEFYEDNKREILTNPERNNLLTNAFLKGMLYHPLQRTYFENIFPTTYTLPVENGMLLITSTLCAIIIKPTIELLEEILSTPVPRYSVSGADNLFANWLDHQGPHILGGKALVYCPSSSDIFVVIEPSRDSGYQQFQKAIIPDIARKFNYLINGIA